MAKNKLPYTALSGRRCSNCGTFLKQNLVDANPRADKDYVCWRAGTTKPTRLQLRKGHRGAVNSVKIDYKALAAARRKQLATS